jgi:outer membrane protein assembly factor BamB
MVPVFYRQPHLKSYCFSRFGMLIILAVLRIALLTLTPNLSSKNSFSPGDSMKNLPLLVLGLICAVFATTASAQQAPQQARNYQIDATHTGAATVAGVAPPLAERWRVNFGRPISYPLIADGRVFVTVKNLPITQGTSLFALDAANGAILWEFNLGGTSSWSGSCYENGRVFSLNGSGLLRAFDGATGAVIWSIQLPNQFSFSSAPTVHEGVIYTSGSGSGGTAYAVNANTGALLWTSSVINGGNSSPAVTSDGVYVSYSCPNVYKLNPANGAKIWHYNPGCSGGGGKTPTLYDGRLYVRDFVDQIFDAATGTIIGSFNAKNTPAFSGNYGFFLNGPHGFGSFGTLQANEVTSNTNIWNFFGDGTLQSGVLVVNNYVYVGSSQGNLYAVDAASGQQVWTTNVGSTIPYVDEHNSSQPLTGFGAGEGLLVIPTSTTLIAYQGDTEPPTLTWGEQTPAPNSAGWNNTPVDLSFTTADNMGVASSDPVSPLHFAVEGANQTQDVTVTDNAANTATFTSPAVNIDLTKPSTVIIMPGVSQSDEWFAGPVPVTLNASDSLSGVANTFYTIDGGPMQNYMGQFSLTGDGTHTVEAWTVDVAGNEEVHKTRTVNIDTTAPVTQSTIFGTEGTAPWYRTPVQVSLTASDNLSGVANTFYRIDDGVVQTYSGPVVIADQGFHFIEYWSVDFLNNTEISHVRMFVIDSVAPVVTATASPSSAPKRPQPVTVTISGNVSDATSGFNSASFNVIDEYGVTQPSGPVTVQADGSYSFTLTLPATKNGGDKDGHLYTIVVTASDQAGNSASATAILRIN